MDNRGDTGGEVSRILAVGASHHSLDESTGASASVHAAEFALREILVEAPQRQYRLLHLGVR